MHRQVAEDHGFTAIADVDILDEEGSMELPVEGGARLESNLVGSHFADYDSYIVLSHFKGHAMAGFGGAIKNISIGLGSKEGKCLIHTAGQSHDNPWVGEQTGFTESMAEAGKSVSDYLGHGERIIYINVLNNISIDCDCDGNPAEPDIHDIGIVASYDPVAIDQACIDLAFAAEGSQTLQDRVNSRGGLHTLEHAEEIGPGRHSRKSPGDCLSPVYVRDDPHCGVFFAARDETRLARGLYDEQHTAESPAPLLQYSAWGHGAGDQTGFLYGMRYRGGNGCLFCVWEKAVF